MTSSTLRYWILNHWIDFEEAALLDAANAFIAQRINSALPSSAQTLSQLINKKASDDVIMTNDDASRRNTRWNETTKIFVLA